jgi:hypothetical protein
MSKKTLSKGKLGSKSASMIPMVSAEEAELILLKEEAKKLHIKAKIEELDFNEFQSQREKINDFWLLEREILEKKRADVRFKDQEIQDLVEQQHFEVKSCQDKWKTLLHKQQTQFSEKLTKILSSQKEALQSYVNTLMQQKLSNLEVEALLRATQDQHNLTVRGMRREHEASVTNLRNEYEKKSEEMRCFYDLQLQHQRENADKQRRFELKQIKDEKEDMIARLLTQHKSAFDDLKNSHHSIIFSNLETIKTLKAELTSLEEEEKQAKLAEFSAT